MSYQVLARKLRPAEFASLVGQDHIVRALRHGLDSGRLHHAYLFTGTRGVGKTTIARILAKCLNCEAGVSASPCGACSVCQEVQENRFVDLIEVDAASRTRVDDTRELLDNAQYLPTRGRYKIYLIDEVHMLSASSFNALLKTLEEPPEHVKFLLATTDPKKVPITVLSRCLQFQLKNIAREKIAAYLADAMAEEGIEFEAEALEIIAKAARGSMRDALSVTDQAIAFGQGRLTGQDVAELLGAVGSDEVAAVLDAIESGNPQAVVRISGELADRAADFEATLAEVLQALHGIAVAKALGQTEERPALSPEAVQLYYQIALTGYRDIRVGPDPKTVFEMTLLRMLAFAPDASSAQSVPPAAPATGQESEATPHQSRPGTASRGAASRGAGSSEPKASEPASGEPESSEPMSSESGSGESGSSKSGTSESGSSELGSSKSESSESGSSEPVSSKPVSSESVPSKSASRGPAAAERKPRPHPSSSAPARTPPGPTSAPRQPNGGPEALAAQWLQWFPRLDLSGPSRAIAEHSVLIDQDESRFRLRLDEAQEALFCGERNPEIEQALSAAVGQPVEVRIETGALTAESPAKHRDRLKAERRAAARRQLEQDQLVQSLITTFDGQLVDARHLANP